MKPYRFPIVFSLILALALAAAASAISRAAPAVGGGRSVISLWGGARDSIVLLSDGTVWDWGMNQNGKLGDNTVSVFPPETPWENGSNDRHLPLQVHGPGNVGHLNSVQAIMGGESHNFALRSDHTVWAWGWNRRRSSCSRWSGSWNRYQVNTKDSQDCACPAGNIDMV